MTCTHDSFHSIGSRYDRTAGVLVYYWVCEGCGARLNEAGREPYKPAFDPHGNDRYLSYLSAAAVR